MTVILGYCKDVAIPVSYELIWYNKIYKYIMYSRGVNYGCTVGVYSRGVLYCCTVGVYSSDLHCTVGV